MDEKMGKDQFEDDVSQWLAEGPSPQWSKDIDDIANEPQRQFHGKNGWWEQDVPTNEQCVRETRAAKRRARARRISRRYGWMFDEWREICFFITSWFTTDVVLGLFRASYGIIMAVLLGVIIYCTLYASNRTRTLPTIEELQRPAYEPAEGSPQPQDGKR